MQTDRAPGLDDADVVAAGRPSDLRHCARYLIETLAPLGVPGRLDATPLRLRRVRTDELLIHPGSGSAAKNWPPSRFAEVMRRVRRPVRLVVGEADAAAASDVEAAFGAPLPRLMCLDLQELAARLAGCRGYLGNDSGVSHLAGLSGANTVVLFGPTPPEVWRPLGPRVHVYPFETSPATIAHILDH
jgi:ADP-heptose:LPS heptosyltransferase